MKRFVIGDIHGRDAALKDVLQKSKLDYDTDLLIVLGDVVDGGTGTKQVIDELLKIKNLVYIYGNHDIWFLQHLNNGWAEEIWLSQGGIATLKSYGGFVSKHRTMSGQEFLVTKEINIPVTHQEFFNTGKYYYELDGKLFVHGGIIPGVPIEKQDTETLLWDRDLIYYSREGNIIPKYKEVYVGHTTTQLINGDTKIVRFGQLYCMDTGAGWNGKLSIIGIDTKESWQSATQKPVRS